MSLFTEKYLPAMNEAYAKHGERMKKMRMREEILDRIQVIVTESGARFQRWHNTVNANHDAVDISGLTTGQSVLRLFLVCPPLDTWMWDYAFELFPNHTNELKGVMPTSTENRPTPVLVDAKQAYEKYVESLNEKYGSGWELRHDLSEAEWNKLAELMDAYQAKDGKVLVI